MTFCLSSLVLGSAFLLASNDDVSIDELRQLLADAEYETALQKLPAAIERFPESSEFFSLASQIAEGAGDRDQALWLASIALELAAAEQAEEAVITALRERTKTLDTVAADIADLTAAYDRYQERLFDVGRSVAGSGYSLNAVDLFTRCIGTEFEAKARAELAELYADPKAASNLARSGVNVPPPPKSLQEIERIAAMDAEHDSWDNAYHVETKNYVIYTDMGFEMSEAIAEAMEQMNKFYRTVFKPKKKLKQCEIRVYKSRDEYLEIEGDRTASGFYVPSKNYVATYDQRTAGWPMAQLWSTLFHEASHQFTHEVTEQLTPGWLNEGTASYFEGAALLPNNSVITNNIPLHRLGNLSSYLRRGEPKLEAVLRYHQPGSYDVTYYPFGWGLVYFMHNFEDDRCNRVFVKPYQKFLGAYRKTVKEDCFDLFVKHIVEGAKVDDVESYEDFEKLWSDWILQLAKKRFGGPAASKLWIEQGRHQLEHRQKEAALESYRYATLVNPKDLTALYELANLYRDLKQRDAAVFSYGKILQLTGTMDSSQSVDGLEMSVGELIDTTLTEMTRVNKSLGELAGQSIRELKETALATAKAYEDGGLPRRGLKVLDDAMSLIGAQRDLRVARTSLADSSGTEIRRWRMLNLENDLRRWQSAGEWWQSDRGLECLTRGIAFTFYRPELPANYTIEISAHWRDREGAPLFGVIFGSEDVNGMQILTLKDRRKVEVTTLKEGEATVEDILLEVKNVKDEVTLSVEVLRDQANFYVNDKMVGLQKIDPDNFERRVGLFVDALDFPLDGKSAELEFFNLRAFY